MRTIFLASSLCVALATQTSSALADGMPASTSKTVAHALSAPDLRKIYPQRAPNQRLLLTASAQGRSLGLYVVRFDSKASGGGYCGAGSEDYLVLARFTKNAAQPLASQRIQSCLETQSLYITDGDDFDALVRHLQPDAAHCAVSFEPLTEGADSTRSSVYIDAAHAKLVSDAPAPESAIACTAIQ